MNPLALLDHRNVVMRHLADWAARRIAPGAGAMMPYLGQGGAMVPYLGQAAAALAPWGQMLPYVGREGRR